MMKRIITIITLCMVLIVPQASAASVDKVTTDVISVLLNGKPLTLDAKPILTNGVTYVPMRSLLTSLGAVVNWDQKTGMVTATHNNTSVKIKAGDSTGWKNGQSITIDNPPRLING